MQTFTAPLTTTYKIECWGASGGNVGSWEAGAKGGYSIGYKSLTATNKLYICVGSKGSNRSGSIGGIGGYNGGGNGGNGCQDSTRVYYGGGGGGGATHVAISDRGELKNYENYYQQELLLVAGAGGGGATHISKGGVGGGVNGGNVVAYDNTYTIDGATQTSGYAFGQGQNGKTKTVIDAWGAEGNGGGGGGFYGGPASQEGGLKSDCAGTGGSGYVDGVTYGTTIAGDQTFPSPTGGTETGHEGNGYCIITWVPILQ